MNIYLDGIRWNIYADQEVLKDSKTADLSTVDMEGYNVQSPTADELGKLYNKAFAAEDLQREILADQYARYKQLYLAIKNA